MQSKNPNLSDKDLWNLLRDDNKDALSQLYKKYIKGLYNFGLKHTSNKELVKDTLQELFTEIWTKRVNLSEVNHVKVYIMKAFRYKLLRAISNVYKTKTYSFEELLLEQTAFDVIEEKLSLERRNELKKQLEKLPERQREVIYLRYFQNLKNEEIAEIINVNYQSVSNLLHRALTKLRKNIATSGKQFSAN